VCSDDKLPPPPPPPPQKVNLRCAFTDWLPFAQHQNTEEILMNVVYVEISIKFYKQFPDSMWQPEHINKYH